MPVYMTALCEKTGRHIGHAFGYYDYGQKTGMTVAFSGKEATANYICAYVRGMLRGGLLHTTASERGEGYIAYKLPKEKLGFQTLRPIANGMLRNSSLKRLVRFAIAIKRGGVSLQDRMDKEKKPDIFVGLVCVREQYQGQGYMRRVMDIAFAEGDRLGVPVILETDAKSKCDKYVHLGMELAGVRDIGEFGKLYDLIKYPNTEKRQPGLNRLRQPLDGWRISIHAEKTKPHITSLFVGAEKIHVKKDQYRRGRFFPCGSWQIRNREYSITL